MLTKKNFWLCTALILVLAPRCAMPQSVTAQITGSVIDASGSSIAEAEVKAVNKQTGVEVTQLSKNDGNFQFLHLPVGAYDISVSKPGFQKYTSHNLVLSLNQVYTLPVTLEIGKISESVEVQADAAQVETSTTQLGTVIDSRQIVDLPLNGRDWTQLEQLSPGVVSGSDRFGSNGANGNSFATNASQ